MMPPLEMLRATMLRTAMLRTTLVLAAVAATLLTSTSLLAQARQQNRPPAITDIHEAGLDYYLQGEYAGWALVPGRGQQYIGLQVIALGEGKFDAVAYRGWLPGNGWDRVGKKKLSGEVEN